MHKHQRRQKPISFFQTPFSAKHCNGQRLSWALCKSGFWLYSLFNKRLARTKPRWWSVARCSHNHHLALWQRKRFHFVTAIPKILEDWPMGEFKLYDVVRVIKDKDFICPVEHMNKGLEGTIVLIFEKRQNRLSRRNKQRGLRFQRGWNRNHRLDGFLVLLIWVA